MSLLNITNDGLPNILAVLHSTLLTSKRPVPKDELLNSVAPLSVSEDEGKQAKQTLRKWTELGLFEDIDDQIGVRERPDEIPSTTLGMLAYTRRIACKYTLAEENNENFWASSGSRSADLTRTLAWTMAQDVYRTKLGELEALEAKQITSTERRLMQNSTRQNGFRFWTQFLGFSRQPGGDIDPTIAVRDVLHEILGPGENIPARDFIERLVEKLPVLDGGRWQSMVLTEVDPTALAPLQDGQISSALSRALLCLRATGELHLQSRADTGSSIVLTGFQGVRADFTFQWIGRK